MTHKELIIEAIRALPDEASLEEISETVAILTSIRLGEEAVAAGQVIPHEEVKKSLQEWLTR